MTGGAAVHMAGLGVVTDQGHEDVPVEGHEVHHMVARTDRAPSLLCKIGA